MGFGAAFLFSTNGALLTTFTNPSTPSLDNFGSCLAAVGTDRILIGAHRYHSDVGVAHLFSTDGTLLTTFTNPTPGSGDYFGASVAALGTDRVLIGAPGENTGETIGVVYLFSTDGTLLTTLANPSAIWPYSFGYSVAAVGTDRVLIGAHWDSTGAPYAGAAYLFNTNGALLTIFTNPTPVYDDHFGNSVAAMGDDRVLIGAYWAHTDVGNVGAAYLFSTKGALLATFTNPTPEVYGNFGISVAAVGNDRVLIGGAGDNMAATDAGAAYLFSTNGALLTTFTKPMPAAKDRFGISVAAVGTDRVLIGSPGDDAGATDAGAVYLFNVPPPSLTIRLTTINTLAVSWPSSSTGWTLQENTNGVASVHWSNAPGSIQDDGTTKTLLINPPTENRFYRLFKPGG